MTRRDHASGSDRVAEVARRLDADCVVNLQGDEPLIEPAAIETLIRVWSSETGRGHGHAGGALAVGGTVAQSQLRQGGLRRRGPGALLQPQPHSLRPRRPARFRRPSAAVPATSRHLRLSPSLSAHLGRTYRRIRWNSWKNWNSCASWPTAGASRSASSTRARRAWTPTTTIGDSWRHGGKIGTVAPPERSGEGRRRRRLCRSGGDGYSNKVERTSGDSKEATPLPCNHETAAKQTKHIFVTGGVVSSLGKGLTCASIGMLLEHRGLRVRLQKFDPYHQRRSRAR